MADLRQNTWILDEWYAQDVAGEANYAAVDPGKLFVWGKGNSPGASNGILGLNDNAHHSSPTQVGTDTTWKSVAVSGGMRATKTDGTLWQWGYSSSGQSGLNQGETADTALSSPTQVGTDSDWDKVFISSGTHTGCFKTDGSLYLWGRNNRGQLGLNDTTFRSSPTLIPGTWKPNLSSSSYCVTHVAKSDGTIWSWGDNEYGELGHNDTVLRSSPVQIASDATTWRSLTTGSASTLAIKTDGTMWSWGTNGNGVLMLDPDGRRSSPCQVGTNTNWGYVTSGGDWSMASKTDGTLWMAGLQEFGQIGNNEQSMTRRSSPIQLPGTNWMVRNCFGGTGKSPKVKQSA